MPEQLPFIARVIDGFARAVSPQWALSRANYRAALDGYQTSYRGAARTRLDTGWSSSTNSTRLRERNLRESYRQMRDRARNLEQDNVLAAGVLDRATENVIGTGVRIRPTSSDPEFNLQAAAAWKAWTHSKTADVRGMLTFGALQRMFYRAKLRDGDCGMILADVGGEPRLQLVEGEHIDGPYGTDPDYPRVIEGIELDDANAPLAFWVRSEDAFGVEKPQRIKARDFVYTHRPALYSSVRGESSFSGSYLLFDQIVGYLESVVVASRVGASQALLIKKKNPAAAQQLLTSTAADGTQHKSFAVQPGMAHYLGLDEDVQAFNPSQPQQQMESAINTFCRFVGLRFGLTIEQVLLNFSLVNYSSSRAARIQADQTAFQEQEDFAATFIARVYPWAVSKWVKNGRITRPLPADGWSYEWIPQGRPWVDPTKEIKAAAEGVALGVETRSNIAMERGYDFGELCKTNASDVKTMTDLGLLAPPATAPEGVAPPPN